MKADGGESGDGLGIALAGAISFGFGLLVGIVSGGLLGDVDSERVKRAVGKLRRDDDSLDEPEDPDKVEYNLLKALKQTPSTRRLTLGARALGGGLVEVTGTAPDEVTRDLIGDIAREAAGVDIVINRVLIEGTDTGGNRRPHRSNEG